MDEYTEQLLDSSRDYIAGVAFHPEHGTDRTRGAQLFRDLDQELGRVQRERAKFATVTGADFGRAIKWHRRTPNRVAAAIRAAVAAFNSPRKP